MDPRLGTGSGWCNLYDKGVCSIHIFTLVPRRRRVGGTRTWLVRLFGVSKPEHKQSGNKTELGDLSHQGLGACGVGSPPHQVVPFLVPAPQE